MSRLRYLAVLLLILAKTGDVHAQGPPIVGDNSIMLGSRMTVLRNLTEVMLHHESYLVQSSQMVHFLPTSRTFLALHVPLVASGGDHGVDRPLQLGDVRIIGKYQWLRKDGTGRTLRLTSVAKATLPTGEPFRYGDLRSGEYGWYNGLILGYESVKYGLINEVGYQWYADRFYETLYYKAGLGVPLLPHRYPIRQVNVYLEVHNRYDLSKEAFDSKPSLGIQLARGGATFEGAFQQSLGLRQERSIFLGARWAF